MENFKTNYKTELTYDRARTALAETLASKGIADVRVLEAILKTPRHLFIDGAFSSRAYEDMSLPIGYRQTISQPYVVAKMTEILIKGNILEKKPYLSPPHCLRLFIWIVERVRGDGGMIDDVEMMVNQSLIISEVHGSLLEGHGSLDMTDYFSDFDL